MDCQSVQNNISAYIDNALDPAECAELEAHIGACPACRREFDETLALVYALRTLAPPAQSPDFAADLSFLPELKKQKTAKKRGFWTHRHILATAASFVLVFGVIFAAFSLINSSQPFADTGAASMEAAPETGAAPEAQQEASESQNMMMDKAVEDGRSFSTLSGDWSQTVAPGDLCVAQIVDSDWELLTACLDEEDSGFEEEQRTEDQICGFINRDDLYALLASLQAEGLSLDAVTVEWTISVQRADWPQLLAAYQESAEQLAAAEDAYAAADAGGTVSAQEERELDMAGEAKARCARELEMIKLQFEKAD